MFANFDLKRTIVGIIVLLLKIKQQRKIQIMKMKAKKSL